MNNKLKAALTGELNEYRSIPFWSWNNSLDEGELVRQIEEMKAAGIGGFIMHARTGLKDEYLGEKWFSCIKACLEKAKELGMQAWVYDENGWPSGFCGGKLLENKDFRARYLEYAEGAFDPEAFAVFVSDDEKGFIRVEKPRPDTENYHNVYLRISPSNTDILNPAVTEAFIRETHEKYYERFAEYFGNTLAGFFTDEPQYYRYATPYTSVAESIFAERGEDIRDGLIWLFKYDERGYAFRFRYYETLNTLYTENFYGKIYDWCRRRGCMLTGHSVEETTLYGQMWGCADVMPSYEYEDIPGIDSLGRDNQTEISVRQVTSVAAQLGKKKVVTESFGCSGYDVTPRELKSIAESQYFGGVNVTCQHLYPYSVAGRGRIDHPPVFGPHGNWNEGFRAFNDYFARLSYIISETTEKVNVAVIHPVRGAWLDYIRDEDYDSVANVVEPFCDLVTKLRSYGINYHFVDERILERHGKAEGKFLRVGECVYDTVIVPDMRVISSSTYRILSEYNGKLMIERSLEFIDGVRSEVDLESNVGWEDISAAREFLYECRSERGDAFAQSVMYARGGEIGDFIFIINEAIGSENVFSVPGLSKKYRVLDLETLTERDATDEFVLKPFESVILIKSDEAGSANGTRTVIDVTDRFAVTDATDNYFVMDYAEIKRGDGEFAARRPIPGIFEDLLYDDYKGTIIVRQCFTLTEKMPLKLVMEKAKLLSATVNGKAITFTKSDYDVNFVEADITEAVKAGENVFEYSLYYFQHDGVRFALFDPAATESLRNCLYYDTSVENAYLKGDFIVNADFSLSSGKSLPPVTDELYKYGYPFFKGEIMLKGRIIKPSEGRAILGLDGRFMTAEITVGDKARLLTLSEECDITDMLDDGGNEITITLRSSMRNVFGPHHYKPVPEPTGVSPDNFEFRGGWFGGKTPERYTDEYNFVPFGLKRIVLIEEKEK